MCGRGGRYNRTRTMGQPTNRVSQGVPADDLGADATWRLTQAMARETDRVAPLNRPAAFAATDDTLVPIAERHPDAAVVWRPGTGWDVALPVDDPRRSLLELYAPVCSATSAHPVTVGHLGQSLDGFIATHSGESQYVTGQENILHLHRMRALSDAVIVGAGTVAADDPQLTTRRVSGPSPLRVVFDPARRLASHYRVFTDEAATTLYVCAASLARSDERRFGGAELLPLSDAPDGVNVADLVGALHDRGCARIFVEGGGVTVSMFLEADLLDRLHVAVAPLIIGDGRPAIRVTPRDALSECRRPRYRVFRMGGDVLFDCDLRHGGNGADPRPEASVMRVI
jgi:diaminohydroxyphosphoribosylaminopyrimidine deaminase/5-amino-6-(5-phosphoribosylamino)uracil reductase